MSKTERASVVEDELVITRVFDAPRKQVFQMWVDPKHLAQWWGPKGFTNPVCDIDVRPGGRIRIDMRAPDGTIYPMSGFFNEIVKPSRLVMTNCALDDMGNPVLEVLNTVTFAELDDKTVLTLKVQVLNLTGAGKKHLEGMEEGWTQTIDRLGNLLADSTHRDQDTDASNRELNATRVFDAPRDVVFRMWTEREHIAKWWGPNGFTTTIHEMDVRPGGVWNFIMHGPDGRDYVNKCVYVEVAPPERLVYDHISGPLFRMTVMFGELHGKTEVAVRMRFDSADLRNRVIAEYGADKGLIETLDNLAEHLQNL